MASRGGQQQQGEAVDLGTLSTQQLTAVKKQLDGEVEHLSQSYGQLAAALAKFRECLRVVQSGSSSLEKDTQSATEFYDAKVKELGANIQGLENIVQGKTNNLRMVEEVLRQKVLAAGEQPSS
ncbi:hypothetical protein BT67DRAFT_444224 [Trichocladium antarcticum]|uniref:Uncharacterized protein n=1 Tax=Trichocladium antarcticum TaxID=1450529 RepID=A0AAN6UF73_9PEZI|nr:hypothetical protein BT67DRAFT_444224 [Trichocladium antarcticum]